MWLRGLIIETFLCEGKDFKFNSRFHFKSIKKKKKEKKESNMAETWNIYIFSLAVIIR